MRLTQKETNMKKLNKKGFTLAELLIVVAIIAVLVAIAIPVFSGQLEKAREATDAANIRAEYAELMTSVVTGDYKTTDTYEVTLTQQKDEWQNSDISEGLSKVITPAVNSKPVAKGKAVLTYDSSKEVVTVTYSAAN